LDYHSSLPIPKSGKDPVSHFQSIWEKTRSKEMLFGSTQMGPHRDDLLIHLANKPAKTFSSEGQKRSCISSLRFAQWQQMADALGHPPLLGIDDFGIQLDKERQMQLQTHLPQFNQVFLTSPYAFESNFWEGTSPRIFTVEKGVIKYA
jgi:DNA replication and repair protein RecF